MAIHVDIGSAKERLPKLIAAALRGEEVFITRDGKPQVKLVPIAQTVPIDRLARRQKIDAILARIDALPVRNPDFDLEWDENGLPI